MKATVYGVAVFLGLVVIMAASPAGAVVFLSDGFEYADNAAMATAGWSMIDTAAVVDVGAKWTLMTGDHATAARYNPPTINGSPGTGKFVISESSWDEPFGTAPKDPTDSGASHNLVTPTFSTIGRSDVWLHADVAAMLNEEGEAIFDIEVSTNGGTTWNNALHRVCPDRGQQGYLDWLPVPVLTFLPNNDNADGFHGRLDLNLSSYAADAANVQVRFRHYEPCHDWWVKLDNVLIDNVPTVHGSVTKFEEYFDRPTGEPASWLGQMSTDGMHEDELTWVNWGTGGVQDGPTTVADYGWYIPVACSPPDEYETWRDLSGQHRQVNRLEHTYHPPGDSEPTGINPYPDFAIIDCNYGIDNTEVANEYMMTPVLDLADMGNVFLGYQDEIWWYTENGVCKAEVLLMRDNDANGPDRDDEVVKVIFNYDQDAIGPADPADGEDPWYAERLFSVPEAAYSDDMFFAWHYEAENAPWWAIDSIKVSGNPEEWPPWPPDPSGDGKIDDADATILAAHWQMQSGATLRDGDLNGDGKVNDKDASILASHWHYGVTEGDGSVPEPSTLTLLLSAAAMAWFARRR